MIRLTDTTFNIPVSIDSQDRADNLHLVVSYLLAALDTRIVIVEQGSRRVPEVLAQHRGRYEYCTVEDDPEGLFHKTRALNEALRHTATPFLVSHDADVLVAVQALVDAVEILRADQTDMIFPYDGACIELPKYATKQIRRSLSLDEVSPSLGVLRSRDPAVGGALAMNRRAFLRCGCEHEGFRGWGGEDNERYWRLLRLEMRLQRTGGPLYHLFHERSRRSHSRHPYYACNNELLQRTLGMTRDELLDEIATWQWVRSECANGSAGSSRG